jgi:dipeptidyl aminopeptidase/acylaminoacyl peptidase
VIRVAVVLGVALASPVAVARSATAQDLTRSDYNRAEQFLYWNAEKLTSGVTVTPTWVEGDRFWYRNRVQDGHEFVLVDPDAGRRGIAFDHDRLAAALSVAADTSYVGNQLPFRTFEFVEGDAAIRFHLADSVRWTCDIVAYTCDPPDSIPADASHEVRSPDGDRVAFVRDENLWVRDVASGQETQVSTDGEAHFGYGVVPEGCCSEVTDRRAGQEQPAVVRWSPDGSKIATHRYDERGVEELHILETAQGRPTLHSYRYALPGDSVIGTYEIHVFDLNAGTSVRLQQDPLPGDFVGGDTIWTRVRWADDGTRLYYEARSRDHRQVSLKVGDAATGSVRTIVEEDGPTLRETNLQIGAPPNWRILEDGARILWFSERDGWGHLYRLDGQTGEVVNRVTEGPWVVLDVLDVDEANGWVYVTGMGREGGEDPYHRQLYRARLDGSEIQRLTPEDADHDLMLMPSGTRFLDRYGRRDLPPTTVVRGLDGSVLQTVEQADITALLGAGWSPPTPFVTKGRDGATDVYGYLYFPPGFDPETSPPASYPVLDYVYPGPQIGPIGTRGFSLGGWAGQHSLPELGFIVFTVDAMGTPWREKGFHDAYYGDMGDNGIPDHIAALKQLALEYPQMDLDRVGIYGHSGGGFASTSAILRHPDFFKVAVSGAGNHDNRAYLHAWGERYQGLLEADSAGDNYDVQANQDLAGNLEGKLLLSYGTLDDNVHPNNTLLLIDRLISENKDFDLMVFPNRNHGHARDVYSVRRTWDYFVEHLLGVGHPTEYEIEPPPGP